MWRWLAHLGRCFGTFRTGPASALKRNDRCAVDLRITQPLTAHSSVRMLSIGRGKQHTGSKDQGAEGL
jgi:hypothetical protein